MLTTNVKLNPLFTNVTRELHTFRMTNFCSFDVLLINQCSRFDTYVINLGMPDGSTSKTIQISDIIIRNNDLLVGLT